MKFNCNSCRQADTALLHRGKAEEAEYISVETKNGQERTPFDVLVLLFFKVFSDKMGNRGSMLILKAVSGIGPLAPDIWLKPACYVEDPDASGVAWGEGS
jgi:hypothetical protein